MVPYAAAIDQGTTSSRRVVPDRGPVLRLPARWSPLVAAADWHNARRNAHDQAPDQEIRRLAAHNGSQVMAVEVDEPFSGESAQRENQLERTARD